MTYPRPCCNLQLKKTSSNTQILPEFCQVRYFPYRESHANLTHAASKCSQNPVFPPLDFGIATTVSINTDTPPYMSKFPMTYKPAQRAYRAYTLAVSHTCDHLPYMEGTLNFDVQGTSKDLKASQTFKFKTRCSLSMGENFKTCSPCL